MNKEIERRFLIKKLPADLEKYHSDDIIQGYLIITPEREVRLRSKNYHYFSLAVKDGVGEERSEIEINITEENFFQLWPLTKGQYLHKIRYLIPYGQFRLELDLFLDDLDGYHHVEVELKSSEQDKKFIPPDWFGKEVTNDPRYNSKNLACYGVPKEELTVVIKSATQDSKTLSIPKFELEKGLIQVIGTIKAKEKDKSDLFIVTVAGGSSSGKTSKVALAIQKSLSPRSRIISLDDYYHGIDFMQRQAKLGNKLTWDSPEAIDLALAKKQLIMLKKSQIIEKPLYDVKSGRRTGKEKIDPRNFDILIVEGLYALENSLINLADLKIFVEIGAHGRLIRRLLRDRERTAWHQADILRYFAQVVEPIHERYIERQKADADFIIINEYNPYIEAKRSGLHEIQLKFKTDAITDEQLSRIGADRLGAVNQKDIYYSPRGIDLIKRDEMIRIRQEDGLYILTYKGPKCDTKFCKRPKFEFEIDHEITEALLKIYGQEVKRIWKHRTLYQLDGVIISLDKVVKMETGSPVNFGKFIEIRSTDKETKSEEKIKTVISRLGLRIEDGIKKSYVEM